MVNKFENVFTHVGKIRQRDVQTDRQTDRQTPYDGIGRTCEYHRAAENAVPYRMVVITRLFSKRRERNSQIHPRQRRRQWWRGTIIISSNRAGLKKRHRLATSGTRSAPRKHANNRSVKYSVRRRPSANGAESSKTTHLFVQRRVSHAAVGVAAIVQSWGRRGWL